MSVTFRVWNAVIYLSTAEPKSAMRDGDRGNRGIGNQEWSGVEQNGAERSRIKIIRIKIKEKCDIIAPAPQQCIRLNQKFVKSEHHNLDLTTSSFPHRSHHPYLENRLNSQ